MVLLMMDEIDIYEYELQAYRREIEQIKRDVSGEKSMEVVNNGGNLTHYALGVSNRQNMLLVGMCSLVEAFLTDVALDHESKTAFDLEDIRGRGRNQLKRFLSILGVFDFGKLTYWSQFTKLYKLRNCIVHGHGGIVQSNKLEKLQKILEDFEMENVLLAGRRIRMNYEGLDLSHGIVQGIINELRESL